MRQPLPILLFGLLALSVCDYYLRRPSHAAAATGKIARHAKVGRFIVFHASVQDGSGKETPVVLRMDALTGESWLLASDQNQWIKAKDNLKPVGIYNNQSK
jgi:hypothetical protein